MSNTDVATPDLNWTEEHSTEFPSMHLRFNGGILEQKFLIVTYMGHQSKSKQEEWRRVPSVEA